LNVLTPNRKKWPHWHLRFAGRLRDREVDYFRSGGVSPTPASLGPADRHVRVRVWLKEHNVPMRHRIMLIPNDDRRED